MTVAAAVLRAKRGGWPWFLPAAVVLLLWFVEQTRTRTVPLWIDVGHSIETSTLLIGPLVAGATALQTVREERLPLRELLDSTPRQPLIRAVALVVGELSWVWAAYLAIAAWLIVATSLRAGQGTPDFELIVAALTGTVFFASAGFAAARVFPHYMVCPIIGVGLYFATWFVGVGETPLRILSPLIDGEPTPLLPYPLSLGVLHSGWFLTLGASVLLAGVLWRDYSRSLSVVLVLFLAGAVLTGVALVRTVRLYTETVGVNYEAECRLVSSVEVCIHPAFRTVLEPASNFAARSVRAIHEATGWPTRLLEVGNAADAVRVERREPGTLGFTASPVGTNGFEPDGLVQGIAGAVVGFDRCDNLKPDDPVRVGLAVWLIHSVRPDSIQTDDFPFAVWFDGLSTDRQSAWLRAHVDELRTCASIEPPDLNR